LAAAGLTPLTQTAVATSISALQARHETKLATPVKSREYTMPQIPDLTDPRYLDEVGWFLYHERYARDQFGGSYDAERLAYSRLLLDEVVRYLGKETRWIEDKAIVSIGCGCTGDLAAFPAAVKIAIDPLLYVYQQLGMLIADEAGSQMVHLYYWS
jgi:hypothetical protein